jgi:hypothetical protein
MAKNGRSSACTRVVAAQVDKSPELFESLNDINLTFLRTMWIEGQVLIEGESLALSTDVPGFSQIGRTVAMASDRLGPELLADFGGKSIFEQTKEPDYTAPTQICPATSEGRVSAGGPHHPPRSV